MSRAKGVAGSKIGHSLRAFREESEAANDSQILCDRFGTRILDDASLEMREPELTADEHIMMDRIYALKEASDAENQDDDDDEGDDDHGAKPYAPRLRDASSTVPPPSLSTKSGDEEDDERAFKAQLDRLPPLIRKHIEECDATLRSLDEACVAHPNASFKAILEDRKLSRPNKNGEPNDDEVDKAISQLRRLSLQPGGRVRGWKDELKRLQVHYRKKHKKPMPPAVEQQAYFLFEECRKRAEAELPKELHQTNMIARATRQGALRKIPPSQIVQYIFSGSTNPPENDQVKAGRANDALPPAAPPPATPAVATASDVPMSGAEEGLAVSQAAERFPGQMPTLQSLSSARAPLTRPRFSASGQTTAPQMPTIPEGPEPGTLLDHSLESKAFAAFKPGMFLPTVADDNTATILANQAFADSVRRSTMILYPTPTPSPSPIPKAPTLLAPASTQPMTATPILISAPPPPASGGKSALPMAAIANPSPTPPNGRASVLGTSNKAAPGVWRPSPAANAMRCVESPIAHVIPINTKTVQPHANERKAGAPRTAQRNDNTKRGSEKAPRKTDDSDGKLPPIEAKGSKKGKSQGRSRLKETPTPSSHAPVSAYQRLKNRGAKAILGYLRNPNNGATSLASVIGVSHFDLQPK